MTRRLLILAAVAGGTFAATRESAIAADFGWDREGGDNLWGNVANWLPNGGPSSADNLILRGTSLDGPQTIDLGGSERLINRIEANGVDGTYTLVNGASADPLRIFLPLGNVLFTNAGSSLIIDANVQLESAAAQRFNTDTTGGQIIVNGNVTAGPFAVGTATLELTSRNLSVDPIVRVAGVIADGPSAAMALTAGFAGDASNHRGVVSVTGLNTYTGHTVVNGATLVFNSIRNVGAGPSALGAPTTVATGTINVGNGATVGTLRYVGAGHSSDRVINLVGTTGGGRIIASGTGALVLTGGITAGASSTSSKNLTLDGSSTADNEISGVIQDVPGTGRLNINKLSEGTWILSGANTYLGATTVSGGTLVVRGAIGSGGTAGTVNLTAGTLRLDGGVITTSALLANASAAFQFRSGTLNLSGSGASSLPNELSVGTAGAGTLNVSGGEVTASFLVVHGVDDAINLSGGTLTSVSIDNSNGGMFTQTGGTLTLVGSAAQGLTTGSGNIAGAITGAGRLTKVGPGTVQVSSSLGYTGPTIVNQGTLRLAGTGRLSDSTAVTINTPGTLELDALTDAVFSLDGDGTVNLLNNAGFVVGNTGNAGGTGTFTGVIQGAGTTDKRGSGTLTLAGNNTYTGQTLIRSGTLVVNSLADIGAESSGLGAPVNAPSATIDIGDGTNTGTLRYVGAGHSSNRPIRMGGSTGSAVIEASGTGPLALTGNITAAAGVKELRLDGTGVGDNTLAGTFNSASGITLRKQGAATWVLTNAISLGSGGVIVGTGELILRGAAAQLNGGRIALAANGAFTLDGGSIVASELDAVASSVFSFRSGSLTLNAAGNVTSILFTDAPFIVGTSGSGAMTFGQAGLATTGNFSFPSGITIQGADDTVTLAARTLTAAFVDNSAGGTFNFTGGALSLSDGQLTTASGTLAGIIQGTGGITKTGPGVLTMAAGINNTYSGPTDINQGTLTITGSGDQLGSLTRVTVAAGATLDLSASNGEDFGALLGDGTVIVGPGARAAPGQANQSTTFGGSITGNGDFAKLGTAILALHGTSDHTGSTSVVGGNLWVRAGGEITSTSTLVISSGTTLTLGDAALGPGSITTGVVDNDNGGTFTWNDGTLRITAASGIRFGTGLALNKPLGAAYTLSSGRVLVLDGPATIEATGALTLAGGTLSTANLVVLGAGSFAFSSGTLRFTMDQTIDTALATMADVASPLGPGRTLEVTGTATIATPLVLAGGAMTFGAIVNPDQLILDSGTLTVTTGGLTVADSKTVDLSTGMSVNVGGALEIASAGQLNLIGASFASTAASTNAGQINAINSTLSFANGLDNSGALNLINSTIEGNVTSTDSTITAAGNTSFNGIIGSDALLDGSIHVQSGANVTAMAVRQKTLSLGSGAKLTIAAGGGMSVLEELNIAGDSNPTATFDVNDMGLVLRADAETRDAILARTTAQIALARSAGWQGPGIASTAASLNPLTTLAVIINATDDGTPLYDVFDGIAVDEHAVLVRYTYNGDADVNGRVDAADFFRLDRGFLSSRNGLSVASYRNGDFNYDGTIDGDDYYLIDSAFLGQAATPGFAPSSAIPEPPALVVPLGWAILALIGRKRRRRSPCIDEATKGR